MEIFKSLIQFENQEITRNLISSVLLVLLIIVLRTLAVRSVLSWKMSNADVKRRLVFQTKNIFWFVLLAGLIVIWAHELRTVAISLVAVAAAVVLATKEIIQCFLGGIYKLSTRPFDIGDKIEVAGFKGDVIDHSMLATTLFEIGPPGKGHQYTGKTLQLPNSIFLTNTIINDSVTKKFVLHTFVIPQNRNEDWQKARSLLEKVSNTHCLEFVDPATSHLRRISAREGFDVPNVNPRVSLNIVDHEVLEFIVRVPVPSERRWHFEQKIKTEYLIQLGNL